MILVEQPVEAPFRDHADLREGDGERIQRNRDGLAVEVAAVEDVGLVRKMRGLSVAEFISISMARRAYSTASRTAPRTWGMHRSV